MPRSVQEAVHACAVRATRGSAALARASDGEIDTALRAMAARLHTARDVLTAANQDDLRSAASSGMSAALQDRLRLTGPRLEDMAAALRTLADVPHEPRDSVLEERGDGLVLLERRRPVGVIGANFEARPNVTLDVASQFLKSRNGGVLRTGSAALRSSQALVTHVITPALTDAGLNPDAIQLVPSEDRAAAYALVSLPETVPLVILRGSGDSTRELGREAARHGVRTLAHADGGGVLYVAADADEKLVHELVTSSLDRLGVCNRLNLLLLDRAAHDKLLPGIVKTLEDLGITASLPPHAHARGYEWSLDPDHAATVTIDEADGPVHAARIANEETSGLAAAIATHDPDTAARFMDAYGGSGVFWNSTTRLLDGFKLLRLPETGINIDRVPGPRGPVTYRDLYLRQYVVRPAASPHG
ncbi:aldehyde dehydrogenase family protein [Streptomyces sp. NBC_00582]|uniref:aldehyde dehydrogenase family protein n=1 Tax=Streptomyces sp. NBC_00582 TaxID=2975783 RepID=UPI002E80968C|nr:aldehyde dehydrogenase family protein [Streptomyces sp. NBC_00582]WUB59115.1 aldehyde dehydrogenase family protein [Streptomyces sp. NBC_00582]WUB67613.1 aldehyde dehydrogenase family protein [Streptomyces sp. NBC_00582]